MSELKISIRKREGFKRSLTAFIAYTGSVISNNQFDNKIIIEITERLGRMEGLFQEFSEIQSNIEEICDEKILAEQYTERENFETSYFKIISQAKAIIQEKAPESTQEFGSDIGVAKAESITGYTKGIKLPTIQLPKFSGSYDQWLEFRDTFNSIIHNDNAISEVQKLHYLRSSLQGQAAQIIRSLQTTEANYQVAWKLLCDRYDNKKVLLNHLVKALFNLPKVKGNDSSSELRKLVDEFSKHLLALEALGQPLENYWDALLIHLISSKLDNQIKREWEVSTLTQEFPTVNDIKTFLTGRCQLLESLEKENKGTHQMPYKHFSKGSNNSTVALVAMGNNNVNLKCVFCDDDKHSIYSCEDFLKLSAKERTLEAKGRKLCINCLKKNHFSFNCRAGPCRKCGRKHHSLLHFDRENSNTASGDQAQREVSNTSSGKDNVVLTNCSSIQGTPVLLSTAIIRVEDSTGNYQRCRALLDSGSESNFITIKLCDRLHLKKTQLNLVVVGINQISSAIKYKTEIHLQSCHSSYNTTLPCYAIDKITENIPTNPFDASRIKIPNHIKLADDKFNESDEIEVLLGANVFWELLCPEQIRMNNNQPILQRTQLGWVLGGSGDNINRETQNPVCNVSKTIDIQEQLKAFWEIEECVGNASPINGDDVCERNFQKTTERSPTGRFVVSIPFIEPKPELGDSYDTALKRFNKLEAKLDQNRELKQQYTTFMREYEMLGHMTEIRETDIKMGEVYYLPHHGVIKESSSTTKLRVVFDGSCKTTNGISLNDCQHVGPTIQDELFSILVRFRTYRYVLSADIEKMYRQVLIKPNQRHFQRILWRENKSDMLKHYTLNTVTYGTASAPFLAIRALQQTAHDYHDKFEKASRIILQDFYVDDLLSGVDTKAEAIQLHKEIKTILESGGFAIRKWVSNNREVLNEIVATTSEDKDAAPVAEKEYQKTLGLHWVPEADYLQINIGGSKVKRATTKRDVLATISKIFDPLGLLGPCIIIAKIMLQQLWKYKLGWDDAIPETLNAQWNRFAENLMILNQIQIPRYVICTQAKRVELHVFSDASKVAYGTCLYIRTIKDDGSVLVHLLCAKSRVAPLKEITIPRLELCGALLAARLANKVTKSLTIAFNEISFWCDSTIVISWIRMPASNLKVFVSHRVAEIQQLTNVQDWKHVSTIDNPADLISRGLGPRELIKSIWWKGPHWLGLPNSQWHKSAVLENIELPEVKNTNIVLVEVSNKHNTFPFRYATSLHKLKRLVAWCLRFRQNCVLKGDQRSFGALTTIELEGAMTRLVKLAQAEDYSEQLQLLDSNPKAPIKGKLNQLSPFIDEEGLLRVGGRLKNSNFTFGKKHPSVLSGKHILSRLIFDSEHKRLLHAGPQLLLASVRERFWPIGGRNLAKVTVHKCITCYRAKPLMTSQLMGDLPNHRLLAKYPFFAVGVDYAGPFFIKDKRGRGSKTTKCYISLFVCFATKAIHLEPVTDLTTEAFLATLRRFISRRGKPTHIYSDNGSNYLGASSKLKELGKFLKQYDVTITDSVARENIDWHFIPANSPHFGGLWEAGIKSSKYHLKRVLTNALVTLEEFLTILTQIESVLNSRPLYPISSSPIDYEPLAPSHFLIGRAATCIPDPTLTDIPINRLSRYQHLQQIVQHFWKRWSREYITQLQQKVKWTTQQTNVKVGDLVVIREDNVPTLKWKMGRIIDTHPGVDGMVRVVTVKTPSGTVKRAVTRVCTLPICADNNVSVK